MINDSDVDGDYTILMVPSSPIFTTVTYFIAQYAIVHVWQCQENLAVSLRHGLPSSWPRCNYPIASSWIIKLFGKTQKMIDSYTFFRQKWSAAADMQRKCKLTCIRWPKKLDYRFKSTSMRPFKIREAQLSPRDRAMRRVNWNLANCHATVQKLLIRQVLTKSMVYEVGDLVGGNAW